MVFKKYFFLCLSIIFAIFCILASLNLKIDASSDTLILKNDETFNYFKYYNNIFPSKNFLVLAIKSEKEINRAYITNLQNISNEIRKISSVKSTFSILDAPILLLNEKNLSDLANTNIDNLDNNNYSDQKLKLILNEFATSPIFKDQIINSKKNISSIIIYLDTNIEFEKIIDIKKNLIDSNLSTKEINKTYNLKKYENSLRKEKLIKDIRRVLLKQNNNFEYFLGGIDMIANDTINFIKKDIVLFSFAVLSLLIIILLIIYKNIKWVLIPLITTIYTVITMTGFIGIMNWEITAISSNFISLMLILSISMNIHIINHYKLNYNNDEIEKKLANTLKVMFWPCLYTSLTTIVAFGSLLFSNIKPIIDFGTIMIFALIIIFVISFTVLPLLISFFPEIHKNKKFTFPILNSFYKFSSNNTKKILALNAIIFVVSIFGIYKLNVENSFINYFKSNTEIHKGMKVIDTELGGTTPLDIIIKFKKNDYIASENVLDNEINLNEEINFDDDFELNDEFELSDDLFADEKVNELWFTNDRINTIKNIHKYLESKSEIGKVQSIYSLIEMANLINKKPMSIFELSILYNEIPQNYKDSLINPFLSIENDMIKISTRVRDSNDIKRDNLINDINKYIKLEFSNIEEFKVNGLLVLYNNMLQSLFTSQIKSFGIILITIFIMFLILFRSFKLSVAGIIPNIIASTFILGLIGLIGIPLDIMTITIAAITIGIAVDNTIHYIYKIKSADKKKLQNMKIEEAHNSVGNAVMTTSLTITFGFSVLCLSNFIPTILFGLFTALAMIIAMIGVLITLPALLYRY